MVDIFPAAVAARRKSKRKRNGRKRGGGGGGWGLEWPEKGCNKKEGRRSGRRCLCLEFITQWYHFVPRRSQATPGTNPGRAEPRQSGWHHGILLPVTLKQFPPRLRSRYRVNLERFKRPWRGRRESCGESQSLKIVFSKPPKIFKNLTTPKQVRLVDT